MACMYVHVHRSTYQSESVSTCQSYDSDRRLKSHGKCFQETDMWYTVPYSNNNVNKTKQTEKSTPSSIIHPGKLCGPCCLCHKSQSTFRHLANMQEELLRYLLAIGHTDCVVVPLCQLKTSISTATARVCTCTCMEGGWDTSRVATQCYVIKRYYIQQWDWKRWERHHSFVSTTVSPIL